MGGTRFELRKQIEIGRHPLEEGLNLLPFQLAEDLLWAKVLVSLEHTGCPGPVVEGLYPSVIWQRVKDAEIANRKKNLIIWRKLTPK